VGNESHGTQIGSDILVNVTQDSNSLVNVSWNPMIGTYEISVAVDSPTSNNGTINESEETNNIKSKNFTLSGWQIVYGEAFGQVVIADDFNSTVFNWTTGRDVKGNIYVADFDASVRFDMLVALGRTMDGAIRMQDFLDADISLNLTNSTDSLNLTFTSEGEPKSSRQIEIFGMNISNVSVINSTNSTSFLTCVLWDSSDDTGDRHYNLSEDLVFVAPVNSSQQGKYGIYDYEVFFPSSLKKQKTGDIASVSFYAEIR
jgi:hypothetical protein